MVYKGLEVCSVTEEAMCETSSLVVGLMAPVSSNTIGQSVRVSVATLPYFASFVVSRAAVHANGRCAICTGKLGWLR